ncbi:hypothetical protein DL95DRAFT_419200 [Leptodontidium sp. 2 PMI_412]|nr:hypothetical protein DL95DRAFT_419200 [Leptodontidium sp. 2 PMI_412]
MSSLISKKFSHLETMQKPQEPIVQTILELDESLESLKELVNLDSPLEPCRQGIDRAFHAPLFSPIKVFVHVLLEPDSPTVNTDLSLIDLGIAHFLRLDLSTDHKISFHFLRILQSLRNKLSNTASQLPNSSKIPPTKRTTHLGLYNVQKCLSGLKEILGIRIAAVCPSLVFEYCKDRLQAGDVALTAVQCAEFVLQVLQEQNEETEKFVT